MGSRLIRGRSSLPAIGGVLASLGRRSAGLRCRDRRACAAGRARGTRRGCPACGSLAAARLRLPTGVARRRPRRGGPRPSLGPSAAIDGTRRGLHRSQYNPPNPLGQADSPPRWETRIHRPGWAAPVVAVGIRMGTKRRGGHVVFGSCGRTALAPRRPGNARVHSPHQAVGDRAEPVAGQHAPRPDWRWPVGFAILVAGGARLPETVQGEDPLDSLASLLGHDTTLPVTAFSGTRTGSGSSCSQ